MTHPAKRLAHQALEPVAFDGASGNLLGDRQAQTCHACAVRRVAQLETAYAEPPAAAFQCREIGAPTKPCLARQPGGRQVHAAALRCEPLATLGTSRVDHGTPIGGRHACTEAMRPGALDFAGLEGALHVRSEQNGLKRPGSMWR